MDAVSATALSGSAITLERAALDGFSASLQGQVLAAGHAGYHEARQVWNAMIDRSPALIARCATENDVIEAVRFAARHGLLTAVRGGGHNVAGKAVCDGGLMIDLSAMRSVDVDPQTNVAHAQAGCLLSDVDAATQRHGLVAPSGIMSSTGIAGLTLGGGFGWLSRKFGLAIDNLQSVRIVTAGGDLLRASAIENADLFWGVRGGGGNFGVVTDFEFRLHNIGTQLFCGIVVVPFEHARPYIQFHREFIQTMPDELTSWWDTRKLPPMPFLPLDVQGKLALVSVFLYVGDPVRGEEITRPLREFTQPHGQYCGVLPFVLWQKLVDAQATPGARNYWKSLNFTDLSDAAIDVILSHIENMPSDGCEVAFPPLGGAVGRVDPLATAYHHRLHSGHLSLHARWLDPADDEKNIAWARSWHDSLRPLSPGGVYVNFLDNEGPGGVREAYPAAVWDKLVAVKTKYDPDNLFRMNQNIPPLA